MEKTRSSQQSQIQALQTQVQSLETTVETLGQFLLQLFETNHDIEIPGDVRRIVQQIGNLDQQRKKPIFVERKIGKSMSVNSNLGFPLKVLEELSEMAERENGLPSPARSKSQFFENTYLQLRKQTRMRPSQFEPKDEHHLNSNRLSENDADEYIAQSGKSVMAGKSPSQDDKMRTSQDQLTDSGIATPLTPVKNNIANIIDSMPTGAIELSSNSVPVAPALHPFGNCEDVNFKFNGTTQLKSLRPIHMRSAIGTVAGTEKHIDGRS